MQALKCATLKVVTIAPGDSIDRAISLMEEHGIHHLVVTDHSHVVGMLSDRDVLLCTGWMLEVERQAGDRSHTVVGPRCVEQIMSRPVETLSVDATVIEAANRLSQRKFGALPILNKTTIVGLISEADLMRHLRERSHTDELVRRRLSASVREWMRAHVITVHATTPLTDVAGLFRRYRFRHLPVVAEDVVIGIISDRDIRRALGWSQIHDMQAEADSRCFSGPVSAMEVMQKQLHTIDVGDLLATALDRLLENHIHCLPVVGNDRLCGIITQTDFIKAIARLELL